MMDEKKELVWANNVFRGWLGEGAKVGVRFQDLITGQKISKIWGKTGWFECHAGESFFRVFTNFWIPERRMIRTSWFSISWTARMSKGNEGVR